MNLLKVVHIIPNLRMGGAERLCLDIIQSLSEAGVKVLLVLLDNKLEYDVDLGNIELYYTKARAKINPLKGESTFFLEFKEKIQSFKPNIVHTHLLEAELLWKSTQLDIHSFFHIHDNIKIFSPFKDGYFRKKSWCSFIEKVYYKKWLKKQSTKFLCISKDTECYIKSKFKGQHTILLRNAINVKKFTNGNKSDLNVISLISIGSLVENKGHLFIVEVVKELTEMTDRKVELFVLGDGVKREEISQSIEEKGLKGVVRLLGRIKCPEKYLAEANIYIHGAFEESFGLVIVEAMAAGLPVFTTDGGGNRDLISQGHNGMIYHERNSSKMAADILEIVSDENKYSLMSKNCREFSKDFDIKKYKDKLIGLYKNEI